MSAANDPIRDYRMRLEAASAGLTPEARAELLDDIGAHLTEIEADSVDAAQVRNALDRLGSPEAIVAAVAAEDPGAVLAPPAPPAASPRVRPLDIVTVLLLVGGTLILLPILGPFALLIWPVAVVMLWVSPTWTAGEKTLGTLVWPGGYVFPLLLFFVDGQACVTSSEGVYENGMSVTVSEETICEGFALPIWLGIPTAVVVLLAPIAVAVFLLRRAQRRAAA